MHRACWIEVLFVFCFVNFCISAFWRAEDRCLGVLKRIGELKHFVFGFARVGCRVKGVWFESPRYWFGGL